MTDDNPRRGGRTPIDEHTRARIQKMAREGMSRNSIARETGVSSVSVSRICKAAGIPFDRAQTAAATTAKVADAKAERARLSQRMLVEAHAALDRLHAPSTVVGWYQGDATEHTLAEPTAADWQRYMLAAAVAVDKHVALERYDGSDLNLSGVDHWLAYVMPLQGPPISST